MTLELTPEQLSDLRAGVQRHFADTEDAAATFAFAHGVTRDAVHAKKKRLQSLLDLLNTPGTTVILHRP